MIETQPPRTESTGSTGGVTTGVPTLEEALAWLKSVPDVRKQPSGRFAHFTIEDLKSLTELKPGGHTYAEDGRHPCLDPAEYRNLLALPALQKLILYELDGLDDRALVYIGQIRTLTYLDLGDNLLITDAGLRHLRPLTHLTHLALWFCPNISDAGLSHLRHMQALETLKLNRTKVSDAGLPQLAHFPALTHLFLSESQVTDAGLPALRDLPALRTVTLHDTQVTDAGLPALAALPKLETLDLSETLVTDAGLPALVQSRSLAQLSLNGTAITDSGLRILAELKPLKLLEVMAARHPRRSIPFQVTEAGLDWFKATRPDVNLRPWSLIPWKERRMKH